MKQKLTAKLTQIEMVRDRGFLIPNNELNITTNLKKAKDVIFNNVYISNYNDASDNDESLYVHYYNSKRPIKDIEAFVEEGVYHSRNMLIGIDKFDKAQTKIIGQLGLKPLELFTIEDLLYNVTHNVYVPKHEKMRDINFVRIDELPQLLMSDPIVRYYGWIIGDIIRVYRDFYDLALLSTEQYGYCVVKSHL